MTDSAASPVEPLCVDAVQELHSVRQIGRWGLDEQVYSVATLRVAWANYARLPGQAVGMTDPAVSGHGLAKGCEEDVSIFVVKEAPLSRIPAS